MARRIAAGALLAVLVGILAAAGAGPAGAATGTYLRLAHLSPDTPDVDVLLTAFRGGTSELKGVGYGDVSSYKRIEPGRYTVQMRMAGAPVSSPPVVTGVLDAKEGDAYTAAGLGPRANLAVRVLSDDLSRPPAGSARVRVVQGAEQAGPVSVRWGGAAAQGEAAQGEAAPGEAAQGGAAQGGAAQDGVAFGTATGYSTVPAGSGAFDVVPASGAPLRVPVSLADGGVYSVVVVQRDGALVPVVQTDALGPAGAPTGGIETGLGGTAEQGDGSWLAPPLGVGLLAAAALGGGSLAVVVSRRRCGAGL